ncbi:uncharacterized protein LOC112345977 isoform X1 [Selaginella moellendorffii]|uniref:uncharacterized protein LOC112345977 isoform X1 n=1 Tax=Selaginella moellendorffii TaxID=88036 RepID=UPI000D1CC25E|nr:uncharacterized protein LOC112345977 isoform X1 [Selaginella moellendorffii]|eukprot:XP_024529632.1 uncharacterized protein LOC112345977 isoform X1 [Selaginella moellendorffii]
MDQKKNILKLPLESGISVSKAELIDRLAEGVEDKDSFKQLCKRIERLLLKHRDEEYKELKATYAKLNPRDSELPVDEFNVEAHEQFLLKFFQLMERGRYKQLTDEEWSVATSSRYLLKLRIRIDRNKLDTRFLSNFTKNQFVIFHRGVSTDQQSGLFVLLKLEALWRSLKNYIVDALCERPVVQATPSRSALEAGETRFQEVERFHAGDIRLSDLFRKARVQEPIYKHVVVLYRYDFYLSCFLFLFLSRPLKRKKRKVFSRRLEHGIRIKHYVDVPLADMELVLPAKKALRPSGADVLTFVLFVIFGSVMFKVLQRKQPSVAAAILAACILYCVALVTTFVLRVRRIKRMLKEKLVRDKRVEKHRDVLISLIKDTIQQEVKLAIVAYFALMKTAHGAASKEDLYFKCRQLMEDKFKDKLILGLDETLVNLDKLGIIWRDEKGAIRHTEANQVTDNHFVPLED